MCTHLDLFSGIGGFSLAAEWAGFKTIGFVECDRYCQKVLNKHWPDVPIVEDIKNVEEIKEIVANTTTGQSRQQAEQEGWKDFGRRNQINGIKSNRTTTPTTKPVTLITGGFPCQPFSVAGKRGGETDDRYLWPEMFNVIKEIRPTWTLIENVTGIINMVLDNLLSDLEGEGYETQTFIIPACAINAPHRRDRIWVVANSVNNSNRTNGQEIRETKGIQGINRDTLGGRLSGRTSQDVPDTEYTTTTRQRGYSGEILQEPESKRLNVLYSSEWWAVEPELGRVAHGIPNRVDRLKCLGNAIVPQVAYQILKIIYELEL